MWPFNFEEEDNIGVNDISLDPNNVPDVDYMFNGIDDIVSPRSTYVNNILDSVDESYKRLDESLNIKTQ